MVEVKLFQAILNNDKENFEDLLKSESEIDFSQRNEDNRTMMDIAVILGRREVLELLLQKDDILCTRLCTDASGKINSHNGRQAHTNNEMHTLAAS